MGTVSKAIADAIIAGEFPDDPPVLKIVKYTNVFNNCDSFGVVYVGQDPDIYKATQFVINPTIYWEPAK